MKNETKTNETKMLVMSDSEYTKTITKIGCCINKIGKGYLTIAGDVLKLYDCKAYNREGDKNIYDMCNRLFGMSRGTTGNLMRIARRFCDNYKLRAEYADFSVTALLALEKYSDEEITGMGVTSDTPVLSIAKKVENADADVEDSDVTAKRTGVYVYHVTDEASKNLSVCDLCERAIEIGANTIKITGVN